MKTNQELLDFYGVELGKRYKVTDQSVQKTYDLVGKEFVVREDDDGVPIIESHCNEHIDIKTKVTILSDYVYEEIKEILTDKVIGVDMTNEQRITLQLAIDNYGIEKQSMVAMEECAELIQAISKMCRKSARNNLVEEIADVQIMIEQLKMMYCISNKEINNVVDIKIQRLSERNKGERNEQEKETCKK